MEKRDLKETKKKIKDAAKVLADKGLSAVDKGADKAKKGGVAVAEYLADVKYEFDLKTINPVTCERFKSFDYQVPSLIQIIEYDKKMENPVCENAIGFQENIKNTSYLCLMQKYADQTDIDFIPYLTNTFYCKNPYNEKEFIALDNYFEYINRAKVQELESVAQNLGAKRVKISFKKIKKTLVADNRDSRTDTKLMFKKKTVANATTTTESEDQKRYFSEEKIASETNFDGNRIPKKPEIVYFKGDSDINTLIKMRLEEDNPIKSKTYEFQYGRGREMKKKDAAGIDAVLDKKGFQGNVSIVSEVENEQRKILEYSIEF